MPLIERDITMTCVSNEVGGPTSARPAGSAYASPTCSTEAGVGDRADQILSNARRLHHQHSAGAHGRPRRHGRDRDERRGAARAARLPGPPDHARPLRLRRRHQVAVQAHADDVRRREAYWTERNWATTPRSRSRARIDTPKALSTIKGGKTAIGGVAWAQHRGVGRSRCASTAARGRKPSSAPTRASTTGGSGTCPGTHIRLAPARRPRHHRDGEAQTAARVTPFPDGATGIQEIVVTVA